MSVYLTAVENSLNIVHLLHFVVVWCFLFKREVLAKIKFFISVELVSSISIYHIGTEIYSL